MEITKMQRKLVDAGVLVVCRAGRYFRDATTNQVYTGPVGPVGSPKYKPGSPAFRVPQSRMLRDESLPEAMRLFIKVNDAPQVE
jgi:hypothetical protein